MSTRKNVLTAFLATVLTIGLAACGGGDDTMEPPDPGMAQMEAAAAAMAAMTAANEAKEAVEAQAANQAVDADSYRNAQDSSVRAGVHAATAETERQAADKATTLADAEAARDRARKAQSDAETERNNALRYAGMVRDENQRVMDVNAARTAAFASYEAADADATKAEAAAEDAEAVASGTSGAVAARNAATAARDAAIAAETAHDAITGDMTKAEADAEAAKAAEQAESANMAYMTAKSENDAIQTAAAIGTQQQEKRDLAAARKAAAQYAADAMTHSSEAETEASAARRHATNARAAANRARLARTDYVNANKYATAAETAANEAEAAATAAMNAHTAAAAANEAAMNAATSDDAEAERDKAKMQKMTSKEQHVIAIEKMGEAMTALESAERYEGVHVIGLLQHANAQDLDLGSPEDVDLAAAVARAKDARLQAVSGEINSAAGMHSANATGDRDQDSSTTGSEVSGSGATATWPADTPADPTASPPTVAEPGTLEIEVEVNSSRTLEFRTEAAEVDDDTTNDIDETIVTATKLSRGLGDFVHGYQISDRDIHAIVFTDKQQGTPAVDAVTAVDAKDLAVVPVSGGTVTNLGTKSGTVYTGVTFYESGGDTSVPAQAFMGTLTCPSPAPQTGCSVATNANNGAITVTGYVFTGSREATAAVSAAAAAENDDWLAFGVWLMEDSDTNEDGNQPEFAAFANGGEAIDDFESYRVLTGTATYSGKATGVHTDGSSVDYFEGDASLTANFGAPGTDTDPDAADDELGAVSGRIDNIMAGGVSTGDVISLRSADIVTTDTAFSGNARMGTGVIQADDSVEYPYNGTWSGNFYGAVVAVPDVMEAAAPEAVAGTFGVSGTTGEGDDAVTRSYVGAFGARRP